MDKQYGHINGHETYNYYNTSKTAARKYRKSYTVCVDVPKLAVFKNLMSDSAMYSEAMEVAFPVGIAQAGSRDNFCKKTGREIAEKRLFLTIFTLAGVEHVDKEKMIVSLKGKDQNSNTLTLDFSLKKDKPRALLVKVDIRKEE